MQTFVRRVAYLYLEHRGKLGYDSYGHTYFSRRFYLFHYPTLGLEFPQTAGVNRHLSDDRGNNAHIISSREVKTAEYGKHT